MKITIPSTKDIIQLTQAWDFKVKKEYRNNSMFSEFMLNNFSYTGENKGGSHNMRLPVGTVLIVDRIYIRNGAKAFDSVTFRIKRIPGYTLPETPRFWVSLKAANKIEFHPFTELIPESISMSWSPNRVGFIEDTYTWGWLSQKIWYDHQKESINLGRGEYILHQYPSRTGKDEPKYGATDFEDWKKRYTGGVITATIDGHALSPYAIKFGVKVARQLTEKEYNHIKNAPTSLWGGRKVKVPTIENCPIVNLQYHIVDNRTGDTVKTYKTVASAKAWVRKQIVNELKEGTFSM